LTAVSLHVERLDTSDAAIQRGMALIDDREKIRAAGFRFARDAARFIARRARLREIIALHTGEAAHRLSFSDGPHGKPMLTNGALQFSLSHSHGLIMVAIAPVEIGCDIERIDPGLEWQPLAERFFSPGERRALRDLPEAQGRRAFFDCWSRKEAYVKALGLGLSYPLDAFDVSVGREAHLHAQTDWTLADAAPEDGYAGAVVTRKAL
jgi:4'-phosphopantetheinyl transferase